MVVRKIGFVDTVVPAANAPVSVSRSSGRGVS